jgi:uncharacterized membrane protein YeiB
MYTNIIVGNKNIIIVAGGAIIIFLVVAILSMLVLRKSNNPQAQQGSSYSTPAVNQAESEMNILLAAQNNSNESGISNLKDTSGMVTVTLNLTGYTPNVAQPAHIHMGVCPGVGAVKYPLNSVVNGKSVTVLGVSLAQLKQQLPLAINVHKSATNIATYTSCGSL